MRSKEFTLYMDQSCYSSQVNTEANVRVHPKLALLLLEAYVTATRDIHDVHRDHRHHRDHRDHRD